MKITSCLALAFLCTMTFGQQPTSSPSASTAKVATMFLANVDKGQIDESLRLWDPKVVNDKLRQRVEKMSSKVSSLGGVRRVDVGTCEQRRIEAHEKKTGEKIQVIPVEIICGNDALLLAVFSVRKADGEDKIFMLESLKEWGGTASLDEELPYQH